MDFDAKSQLLFIYSAFFKYLRKKWEYNEAVHQLLIDFKNASDSVMRAVLHNILIEFRIPMKLVRLIKMFLSETYSRVWVSKYLSDMFPNNNDWGEKDMCLIGMAFQLCFGYAIRRFQVNQNGFKLSGTYQLLV